MISRRLFLRSAVAGLLAVPLAAEAQQAGKVYRVGLLWEGPAVLPEGIEGFRRGLRDLGWVEGRNLVVESRWSEGRYERLAALAQELVQLKVDVILAPSSVYAEAARRATSTIPIVFAVHADPIGSGHVASLARPGGNLTGVSLTLTETYAKGLDLLREAVPRLSRVAVFWNPATPSHGPGLNASEVAGRTLGLRIQAVGVRTAKEFDGAFSAAVGERAGGLLVLSTPLFIAGAKELAELALKHRLPTMFGPRAHAEAGGLLSYGPDRADLFRRAAGYVDRILKGAKPSDLPVEQATNFELIVNLRTAKALHLTLPQSMLLRRPRSSSDVMSDAGSDAG